jgi:hypothetical protein
MLGKLSPNDRTIQVSDFFFKPDICVWNFHIWTNPCKALSTKPYLQVWVSDWEMPRSPLKRTFDHYWLCVGKCMHIWAMWAHICTHGFGWNFKTLFFVAEEESAVADVPTVDLSENGHDVSAPAEKQAYGRWTAIVLRQLGVPLWWWHWWLQTGEKICDGVKTGETGGVGICWNGDTDEVFQMNISKFPGQFFVV